ncbi:helicase-exonuclease AddAB subunit AddB [Amphibacillus sediminis]|uniref:helicase-exonuclease AddAB subunit AddB n=1 Tax=Amphibacillus sediminis TaxID=360185 RepID=UPI0008307E7E|nr:helicase-exonuclease AddAB subunit AddB [Amphibacillus sediminis]
MTVRFLLGPATTSKSDHCVTEIRQQLAEQPQGQPIIYLVPDQMTFQQEYTLLAGAKLKGSIRAQVLSFSRLAFRVMQECGGVTKPFISSTGIQMMLRKIIEQKKTDWRIFQKSIEKRGFIEQVEAMITEFKRYQITPEMIATQATSLTEAAPVSQLSQKLEDLHYLYASLTDMLANQYVDGEDRLTLLTEKIPSSAFLKDAIIYVDGFHRFTPQEQAVLAALMDRATSMTFTLTLDPEQITKKTEKFNLFNQTKDTFDQLHQLALDHKQTIRIEQLERSSQSQPYLVHLERYFDKRPAPPSYGEAPIDIAYAVHPRAEVEGVAQQILKLVREHGYRYRDIAILMRDSELYHHLIATLFEDYHIPVFIDEKRTMLDHPLIEFIRSALDVVLSNWRYEAIFRLLKTGLLNANDQINPLDREAIDTLENYIIEYGIRGRKQWTSQEPWIFQRFKGFDQAVQTDYEKQMQERVNRYRHQVVTMLAPFDQALRAATTVREQATALYQWLEQIGIPLELEEWKNELDQLGKVEQAREQEQVWQAVIQLLDEMVELIGDETLSIGLFQQTLEAGLDTLTYAHVPPTLDHVVVGSIDRSRMSQVKVAFLLGVNEGQWPSKPKVDTILSEEERMLLNQKGLTLADGETQQLIDDWFYIYLAVTKATDRLWLSCPLSDHEGKTMMPASLIKRIRTLFPDLSEPLLLQDPEEMIEAERFITTPRKTLSALTAQLAKYQRAYPIDSIWWSALKWFMSRKDQDPTIEPILQSLFYRNEAAPLSPDTVDKLYSKEVKASVSRLETYHQCSYQYFAKYSLNLSERSTYKLDAPDIGQLFHEALKQITEWIQLEGRSFGELNQAEAQQYAVRAVTKLAPILQHQILHSSNRYQYMKKKLEQIIARATYVLSEQSRKSQFTPIGLEIGFGLTDQSLPPTRLPLPNGYELVLRGRIDRVDQAMLEDQLYLRIIDYKSSAKGLNLIEVYYGLALQMLAYLDVILANSEHWLGIKAMPAGVLYFHVHDPILSESQAVSPDTVADKLFKKYKMQGLLIDQEQVISLMDKELDTGMSSIIPAGLKKDGTLRSGSQVASTEMFDTLQDYVRSLMVRAGVAITSGDIELNPYQRAQQNACQFCDFKSLCQFDPSLPNNQYRKLAELPKDQLLTEMLEGSNRYASVDRSPKTGD